MAIAFDAAANGGGGPTGGTFTISHTTSGSNRVLLVNVWEYTGDLTTGVTYAGTAMTLLGKMDMSGSGGGWSYWYGLVAPATGANNIVASASGASEIYLLSASYTGVSQTGLPDAIATHTVTGSPDTTSITTIADNAWLVMFARSGGGVTISASTGATERVNSFYGWMKVFDSNGALTPAGSHGMTTTWSSVPTSYTHILSIAPTATPATGSFFLVMN